MSESRVIGSAEVIRRLTHIRNRAVGVVTEEEFQRLLRTRVLRRFNAEESPDGTRWPELEASTVTRKRYKGKSGKKLLVETGRLKGSIDVIRGSHAGLLATSTGLGFRVGVTDPDAAEYGRLHNYGLGQKRRQFIGLNALDATAARGFLLRRLKSIAKGG